MKNLSFKRILVYLLGIFVMAIGVSLSINSGLGITPISSIPYVASEITGANMTICMTLSFTLYVILQIIILGREANARVFLQILVAFIFGFFTDLTGGLLNDLVFNNIIARLALSFLGAAVLSLGLTMYVPMNLPVLPPEGLSSALNYKFDRLEFHHYKMAVDITSVIISIILSIVFLGKIEGIGIGTIIAAVFVGRLIPILSKPTAPIVNWALGSRNL